MSHYFGIYGFDITRPISAGCFTITPRFTTAAEVYSLAIDPSAFHLTAIGRFNVHLDLDASFDLAAALTFCQQQWVMISKSTSLPDNQENADVVTYFQKSLDIAPRRDTQGAAIGRDAFYPTKREGFLRLCLSKLADEVFDQSTDFRRAFFRHVESWRLYQSFVDVTYYLDFSALEILARGFCRDKGVDIAVLATSFLNLHGFCVRQDDRDQWEKGIQTYAHLRNALFHNGLFEKGVKGKEGEDVILKLADYEGYLRRLVPDLLLRVLGFNDPHINWNRWLDRMPFR